MARPTIIDITPVTLTELTIIVESTNGIEVKTLADCSVTSRAITLSLPRPPYDNVNLKFYSQGYNVGILENVSGLRNSIELTPTSDYIKTSDGTNNYYVKDNYSRKFGDDLLSIIMTKAETDLSNVTDTGYIKMAGAGMPSNTYIDLTLGASGSSYTAPANGYFVLYKVSTAGGQYIQMINKDANNVEKTNITVYSTTSNQYVGCTQPCAKGVIMEVSYSMGGATQYFRFTYAQGSESEV